MKPSSVSTVSRAALVIWLELSAILLPQIALGALMAVGFSRFAAQPYVNLLSTALCCGIFVIAIIRFRKSKVRFPASIKILIFFIATIVTLGLIIGKISNNPVLYIISDSAYLTSWVLGAIAAVFMFSTADAETIRQDLTRIGRWTVYILLLTCLISIASRTPPSPLAQRLALCYLISFALYPPLRNTALFAACLLVISQNVFGFNRALILTTAASAIYIGVQFRRAALVSTLGVLVAGGVLASLTSILALLPRSSELARRIIESQNLVAGRATLQNSLASLQRIYEANIAFARLKDAGPINLLFGFGSGATIDARALPGVDVYKASFLGLESLHNIHFLHIALAYRAGCLGILLLATVVLICLIQAVRARSPHLPTSMKVMVVFTSCLAFSAIVFAATASNFLLADPTFGFLIAAGVALLAAPVGPQRARGAQ